MVDFAWVPEHTRFILAIMWSMAGFACYFFLSDKKSLTLRFWKFNPGLDIYIKQVLLQRTWGLLFLGILPAGLILLQFGESLSDFGLGFSFEMPPPWWSYLLIPVILVAGYFSASTPGNLSLYPQMRIKKWTPGILALSGLSWIVFLIAYEFLFRGFLLYATLTLLEPWSAIAINCTLYAFAHFYKGPGETFGAIPLGILFCYLTLLTGNIWSAVVVHSIMALSNEWYSIWINPDLKVKVESRKRKVERGTCKD